MKSVIFSLLIVTSILFSQPIFEEHFPYAVGQETLSSWAVTGAKPFVEPGSLNYAGYNSDVSTNKLLFVNNTATTLTRSIPSVNSNNLYCSFLIHFTSVPTITSQAEYLRFGDGITNRGYLVIKKGNEEGTFQLGLKKKDANTPLFNDTDLLINQTHLIVIGYSFIDEGTNSDICKLWINPSLTGDEPTPTLAFINTSTTDATSISQIKFNQSSTSGSSFIDAIRVACSWAHAPLPVELSSFTAEVSKNRVGLNWITESEVDNYGFEIERSYDKLSWECIGFIEGCGNSNSPKRYSTYDDKMCCGEAVYYRLKQIDTDGTYSYSKVVEISVEISGYELYQNYPNPFNPETTIKWKQEKDGAASIRIYNAVGILVKIINKNGVAGVNEMNFSANGMSSGIYYYELETGEYRARKGMIVMK